MKAIVARVSTKFQVVIPRLVRETLGLESKSSVLFLVDGDTVTLRVQPRSFTEALQGLHGELWADPDVWVEQERAAWE